jgi:hypothetical protein
MSPPGLGSAHFGAPIVQVVMLRPGRTSVGEVLTMGEQAPVQLASEQRDSIGLGLVTEPVATQAELAMAAG